MRYGPFALTILSVIAAHVIAFVIPTFRIATRASRTCANPVTAESNNLGHDIPPEVAHLWFDEAHLSVKGGSGGAGASAYRFGKNRQRIAATGGSGGDGGSVVFVGDGTYNTLLQFRGNATFRAENGKDGEPAYLNGKYGANCFVQVPVGTTVYDSITGRKVVNIEEAGQKVVIAKGGKGGQGNANAKAVKGTRSAQIPAQGGERRELRLEMKLIADIGLVGVPNAGKSTLLDAITNARPKIASYPFTTIVPNLGVCEIAKQLQGIGYDVDTGETMTIADIPGLLEGAHRGVGLGRGFLRHVERCRLILHVVNGDSADPVKDFEAINRELELYSPVLASKPQVVVLNKIDLPEVADRQEALVASLRGAMRHSRLLQVSAAQRTGIPELVQRTWMFLRKLKLDGGALP
jgi:GTP-binding protein